MARSTRPPRSDEVLRAAGKLAWLLQRFRTRVDPELTQAALADKAHIGTSTYSEIERGTGYVPKESTFKLLLAGLHEASPLTHDELRALIVAYKRLQRADRAERKAARETTTSSAQDARPRVVISEEPRPAPGATPISLRILIGRRGRTQSGLGLPPPAMSSRRLLPVGRRGEPAGGALEGDAYGAHATAQESDHAREGGTPARMSARSNGGSVQPHPASHEAGHASASPSPGGEESTPEFIPESPRHPTALSRVTAPPDEGDGEAGPPPEEERPRPGAAHRAHRLVLVPPPGEHGRADSGGQTDQTGRTGWTDQGGDDMQNIRNRVRQGVAHTTWLHTRGAKIAIIAGSVVLVGLLILGIWSLTVGGDSSPQFPSETIGSGQCVDAPAGTIAVGRVTVNGAPQYTAEGTTGWIVQINRAATICAPMGEGAVLQGVGQDQDMAWQAILQDEQQLEARGCVANQGCQRIVTIRYPYP